MILVPFQRTYGNVLGLYLILLAASPVWAVTISGKILDQATGESVPSAAVQVVGTSRGAAADVEGLFSIPDLPAGTIELKISAVGYRPLTKNLMLTDGKDQHLTIKLASQAIPMGEVNVETKENTERDFTPQAAQFNLPVRELSLLPQVVESDLFRSLQIVPGVLPSSDFSADLNIWGGSSDQNLILLNGIDVYKPTHLGGLFSIFNMDAVKDVKLIKGGFGAKYGGRLSAVVDVTDREGNRNRMAAKVGISLLSSNATVEGPLPQGSWLVSGRRTYLDWATKTLKNNGVITNDFPYYFYDLNAKVTRDFANGDRLTPSAYTGRDVLSLTSTLGDHVSLSWGNTTYSLPFVHVWSHRLFSTNTVAGSFFGSNFRFGNTAGNSVFHNSIQDFTFKTDCSWFASVRHTLDFGIMAKDLDISLFSTRTADTLMDRHNQGWQLSGYVSDDYRLNDSWTVTPGFRLEHNEIAGATDFLPRLSARKQLNENSSINAAWGLYTQYLQLVSNGSNIISIFDSYVPLDRTLRPNRSQQVALTYDNTLGNGMKFTTDAYYKQFQRIIEYKKNNTPASNQNPVNRPLTDLFNEGDGRAYGVDVFLQGAWNKYSYMAGYGLGRSLRSFSATDNGKLYPANFDRLHNTNLIVSRKVRTHGTLEVRFNYGTGQPITKAIGVFSPGIGLPGQGFELGSHNNFRLPSYQRLDVAYRLRYEYKHWTFAPYFEIINILNHKNVLTLDYNLTDNPPAVNETTQLPFLPSFGFMAEF